MSKKASFLFSFLFVFVVFLCCPTIMLKDAGLMTIKNDDALLNVEVINKDTATILLKGKRIKVLKNAVKTNKDNTLFAKTKMTYLNRKKKADIRAFSENNSTNDLKIELTSPLMQYKGKIIPARMKYLDIKVNGDLIKKEVETYHNNGFSFIVPNVENNKNIELTFSARKYFPLKDFALLKIVAFWLCTFILLLEYKVIISKSTQVYLNDVIFKNSFSCLKKVLFSDNKILFIVSAFVVYFLFLMVSIFTPYHSDDWSVMNDGVNFHLTLHHWLNKSGRLFAYIAIRTIFYLRDYNWLISMISMISPIIVCYLAVKIPSKILNRKIPLINFLLVAILYWISNPNLGQTTFWIVGAANYLWTCMMVLIFINYFISNCNTDSKLKKIVLFVLAVISGCTNEHTSLVLLPLMCGIIYLLKLQNKDLNVKKTIPYLVGCFLGICLMMGAPGNYVRAGKVKVWGSLSFIRKVGRGLERFFNHLFDFNLLWPILFLGFYMPFKYMPNFSLKSFVKNDEKNLILLWAILFVLIGFLTSGVMIMSPSASARTFNNTLVFFLVGLAFLFNYFEEIDVKNVLFKTISFLVCFVVFVKSYSMVLYSYHATYKQAEVRFSIIDYYKNKGETKIVIPDFYFPILRTDNDKFDTYFDQGMGNHFKVHELFLNRDVYFDYSVINTGKKVQNLKINSKYNNLIVIGKSSNLISNGVVMLGSSNKSALIDKCKLQITNKDGISRYEFQRPIEINDRYYTGTEVYNFDVNKDNVQIDCDL